MRNHWAGDRWLPTMPCIIAALAAPSIAGGSSPWRLRHRGSRWHNIAPGPSPATSRPMGASVLLFPLLPPCRRTMLLIWRRPIAPTPTDILGMVKGRHRAPMPLSCWRLLGIRTVVTVGIVVSRVLFLLSRVLLPLNRLRNRGCCRGSTAAPVSLLLFPIIPTRPKLSTPTRFFARARSSL